MTDIKSLNETWDKLGKHNALWAVLSDKKQWNEKEFFETGRKEIQHVMNVLKQYKISVGRDYAMDFGCGVGRLSQALSKHFNKVVGVDIAQSMVKEANRLNKLKNVSFRQLSSGDLKPFKKNSLDFIFTDIVFQHMENQYAMRYVNEMYRVLKKGGVLVFQLPSQPTNTWKGLLIKTLPDKVLTYLRKGMEMHPIRKEDMVQYLKDTGFDIVTIEHDKNHKHWQAFFYYVRKL